MTALAAAPIINVLFVAADIVAARYLVRVYLSGNMDAFIVLMLSAFLAYSLGIRLVSREREFAEYEKKLEKHIPKTFFWMRMSHLAALVYLPVAFFVLYLSGGGKGDDCFLTLAFMSFPVLTVFLLLQVGSVKRGKTSSRRLAPAYVPLFLWSFAFFDVVFIESERTLSSLFLAETGLPGTYAWVFAFLYRAGFLWFIFFPMRFWVQRGEPKTLVTRAVFLGTVMLIFFNGFLRF